MIRKKTTRGTKSTKSRKTSSKKGSKKSSAIRTSGKTIGGINASEKARLKRSIRSIKAGVKALEKAVA